MKPGKLTSKEQTKMQRFLCAGNAHARSFVLPSGFLLDDFSKWRPPTILKSGEGPANGFAFTTHELRNGNVSII